MPKNIKFKDIKEVEKFYFLADRDLDQRTSYCFLNLSDAIKKKAEQEKEYSGLTPFYIYQVKIIDK